MTEIEQLKADLQTLEAAASIADKLGCANIAKGIDSACMKAVSKQIAALEAEQPIEADPWKDAKDNVASWLDRPQYDGTDRHTVALYVCHLEATIARDTLAYGNLAAHAAELLKERNEARNELAKRPFLEAADELPPLKPSKYHMTRGKM